MRFNAPVTWAAQGAWDCASLAPTPFRELFCQLPRTHHPYTFAVPSPYLGRFMFGFRLKAKSEHEAAQVRRWYGEGVSDIPGLLGGITSRHSALSLSLGIKIGRAVRFALLDGKREDKSVINPIYSFIFMCRLST